MLPVRDCTLNGHAAFLLRTEYPGKAYRAPNIVAPTPIPQPNIMFEIVGPKIPGVSYGATLELVFDPDPSQVRKLPVSGPSGHMIANLVPVTLDDVYLEWGKAEIPGRYRPAEPTAVVAKMEAGEDLDAEERRQVVAFMRGVRGEILSPPLDMTTQWFRGELPLSDVGDVLVDGYWTQRAIQEGWSQPIPYNVRMFADHPHPTAQALTITGAFRFASMRGSPILVGPGADGPWGIAEGSNRLRAMWRARAAADAPEAISVLVGVHPMALRWKDGDVFRTLALLQSGNTLPIALAEKGETRRAFCPATKLSVDVSKPCFDDLRAKAGVPVDPNPEAWVWLRATT